MNLKPPLLLFCLLLFSVEMTSQNAPVTTVGSAYEHNSTVIIPVTVTDFNDIGAISLTLTYNPAVVSVSGIAFNPTLPGFTADFTTDPGKIIMGWFGSSGVNLPDNSHLADITFTGFVSGNTDLIWFDNGTSCEYAKFNNGSFTLLNDSPTGIYYKNGRLIHQRSAPVTIAPFITTAVVNQVVCVPVTVVQFTDIGSISLTLDYDPAVLTFQSITSSTIPGTWMFQGQTITPGRLIVGGFGPGIASLPDSAILFTACFMYNGGSTPLAWYDANGTNCEYADATSLWPLFDLPQNAYYVDGEVNSPLIADFVADTTTPPRYTPVKLIDNCSGNPTSWFWSFDRNCCITYLNNTTCFSQHPQIQFNEGGPYTTTLVVHHNNFSATKTKVSYIQVGIPGVWNGDISSDWTNGTNWDNWQTPGASTDVVIPAAANNWPVVNGNLIIGQHCKTLKLDAASSQLTVTGDIVLQ